MKEPIDILRALLPVLNMSDSEHPDFADSCADVVQALWEHTDDIREAVANADKAKLEDNSFRSLASDLLEIVQDEYNDDPEPEDLTSWKELIERANRMLERSAVPLVAPADHACEAMMVELIGYNPARAAHRRTQWQDELDAAKPTAPLPPEDPDYIPGEQFSVSNADRAGWASLALQAYTLATGSELEYVIKDLIGDLGHFCDRHGLDLFEMWEDASGMYGEETQQKGEQFNAK